MNQPTFHERIAPVIRWLADRRLNCKSTIERISFSESTSWKFTANGAELSRPQGDFFKVKGVGIVGSNLPAGQPRYQPIIDQPEHGILGFLARYRDGVLQFLLHAKPEPGNVGLIQIAPTVQATESNYKRKHGGRATRFLEYFTNPKRKSVLLNQLQSEQGTRFLKKRNRNMVVLIDEDLDSEMTDHFFWASARQIKHLLRQSNTLNTDSRSVLACLPLAVNGSEKTLESDFERHLRKSMIAAEFETECSMSEILDWFTRAKLRCDLSFEVVSLRQMKNWQIKDDVICHQDDCFFEVRQIRVALEHREVKSWDQPIVSNQTDGLIGLICQRRRGVMHFLVQAKWEPCHFDNVELTATVDCFPKDLNETDLRLVEPYHDLLMHAETTFLDLMQSDEGSRFFMDNSRYLIREIDAATQVDLHEDFCWMTLAQIFDMLRFNNIFTNQMRSLLAVLRFAASQ